MIYRIFQIFASRCESGSFQWGSFDGGRQFWRVSFDGATWQFWRKTSISTVKLGHFDGIRQFWRYDLTILTEVVSFDGEAWPFRRKTSVLTEKLSSGPRRVKLDALSQKFLYGGRSRRSVQISFDKFDWFLHFNTDQNNVLYFCWQLGSNVMLWKPLLLMPNLLISNRGDPKSSRLLQLSSISCYNLQKSSWISAC